MQAKQIEPFILGNAVEVITSPDTLTRIREEVERLAKAKIAPKGDTRALKAKLRALSKKIDKGAENFLLADAETMPAVSKVLAEWREQRCKPN